MRSLHGSFHILVILLFIFPLEFSRAQQAPIVPIAPIPLSPLPSRPPSPVSPSPSRPPSPVSPSPSRPPSPVSPSPSRPPSPGLSVHIWPPTPCYQCNLPNTCSCSYQITNYVSCRLSELRSKLYSSLNEINKQLNCLRAGGRICALNNVCYAVRTVPRTYSAARSSCSNLRGYIVSTYTVSPNVAERCMDLEEDGQYWVSGSSNRRNCPVVLVNSDHSLSSNTTSCRTKLPYICQIRI